MAYTTNSTGIYPALRCALFLLVLIGIVSTFRFSNISSQGLWLDEIYTISLISGYDPYLFEGSDLNANTTLKPASFYRRALDNTDFRENFLPNIVHEGHPPLYYLAQKVWQEILDSRLTDLRAFSIFFSAITIALIFLISLSIYGKKSAVITAILFALSPMQTFFSLELRGYSFALFLCALATYFIFRWEQSASSSRGYALGWILSSLAACLTHYYALLYLFCLSVSISFAYRGHLSTADRIRRSAMHLAPFLLFLLWTPILYLQTLAHGNSHWTQGAISVLTSLYAALKAIVWIGLAPGADSLMAPWIICLLGVAFIVLTYCALRRLKIRSSDRAIALTLPLFFLCVAMLDYLLEKHTILIPRYAIFLSIPLFILIGRVICVSRWPGAILFLLFSGVLTTFSVHVASGDLYPKQMIREAAYYIDRERTESSALIVVPSGPLLIGIALYSPNDMMMAGTNVGLLEERIEELRARGFEEIWVVEQRLGLRDEPWAHPIQERPVKLIRFAGIDVKKY